jgi:hypothetical protein
MKVIFQIHDPIALPALEKAPVPGTLGLGDMEERKLSAS